MANLFENLMHSYLFEKEQFEKKRECLFKNSFRKKLRNQIFIYFLFYMCETSKPNQFHSKASENKKIIFELFWSW